MPTYPYACTECGHRFEAVQAFSDDSLTECPVCSGRLRKVFSSVGIVFKGSGFYRTDSRAGAVPQGEAKSADGKGSDTKGSDTKGSNGKGSDSKGSDSKGSGPKPDAGKGAGTTSAGTGASTSAPSTTSGTKGA